MILNSVVIDTNLVFSALIPKASQIRDILFESNMSFYSPNILISEVYKYKDKLIKSSKLSESEFYLYFNGIIEQIKFIPTDLIGLESRQKPTIYALMSISKIPLLLLYPLSLVSHFGPGTRS